MTRALLNIYNPVTVVKASKKDHMVWHLTAGTEEKLSMHHQQPKALTLTHYIPSDEGNLPSEESSEED